MPHYRDGTPAQVGDLVKGKGYNLKDKAGNLREVVGEVLLVNAGSEYCNIQLAVVQVDELPADFQPPDFRQYQPSGLFHSASATGRKSFARVVLEYGQCDQFEKIG